MDYAAWTRRAATFLRSLTHLPGHIEVDECIEPPGTDVHTQQWLFAEKCSIPPELQAFVAKASKRCYMRYFWRPPVPHQARLHALFPDCDELTGGADFCEANRFQLYDQRDWFEHDLPPLMQQAAIDIASLFPQDPELTKQATDSALSWILNCVQDDDREHGRVALLQLAEDGQIALEFAKTDGSRPVVFVDPIDPARKHVLCASFDEFLSAWEQLCYITPNLKNLAPWIDPADGHLNPNNSKASLLRGMLTSATINRTAKE